MSTKYTFEELAAAAASSTNTGEVLRALGLEATSKRKSYVSALMRRLGIDTRHFRHPKQLYTREMLEAAAAEADSIAEVVRRLGAMEVGGTQAHIGRLLRRYEIDISHFESLRQRPQRPIEEVSPTEFAMAIGQARTIAQVSRLLGVADNATFRRRYRYQVMNQGLDVSHMLGQAHARGTRVGGRQGPTPAEILVADPAARGRVKTRVLRAAMIEVGIPYRCALCDNDASWQGHQITLEIDHISGDITDNRPQNLRFLCPNCHATTPTFCRKKRV